MRKQWQKETTVSSYNVRGFTLFTYAKQTLVQIWLRNQKLYRQATVKQFQHHHTSFTTKAKGASLSRKHKRRRGPTINKPPKFKKMSIGSCLCMLNCFYHVWILCNPMDCSPPGSSVHGILQARILEWVAISFSNAWKWKVKVKLLSRVQLLATPRTAAHKAPPSMGFSSQECWCPVPLPSPPCGASGKESAAMQEIQVWSLG